MLSYPSESCPDCGGIAKGLGPIPASDLFAGRILDRPLQGGYLFRCNYCALGFRRPWLGKDKFDSLYINGDELAWTASADSRDDWTIARDWIRREIPEGGRILDVGCFDGGFLEPLLPTYDCHGIEIHPAARSRAKMKGIELIGSDFSAIAGTFDCITAFDVIEHVEAPKSFLHNCLAAVRPGGCILLSTANFDSLTFRLMGSRYWYCTIPEHISFISPVWLAKLARQFDYQMLRQAEYSHAHTSKVGRIRQALSNFLCRVSPSTFRALRRLGFGRKRIGAHSELADHPPPWTSARDHFLALIQKR